MQEQQNQPQNVVTVEATQLEQNDFIHRVYGWMSVGLLVTSVIAYVVASTPSFVSAIVGNLSVFYILIMIELVAVLVLSWGITKFSSTVAAALFLLYSALNGLTISVIFLVYTISSIGSVFIITAGMFAILSAYGFYTKKDLTTVGNFAFMALVGIVLASIVNLFIFSDKVSLIISYLAVFIFIGLTAYDTQKIKNLNSEFQIGSDVEKKASIIGALTLYLDFVNLFLNLLRIMGRRR